MKVVLLPDGEIEVDDQGDLLDIDTSCKEIGGDKNSGGGRPEGVHDLVALELL